MANYPVITFDENTNYEEVELIVKSMYDCVLAQGDVCCKSKSVSSMLCEADVKRRAMIINKEFGNTYRYEANVKDLYNLLYNSAYCYDYDNPIVVPLKTAYFDPTSIVWPYLLFSADGGTPVTIEEEMTYYNSYSLSVGSPAAQYSPSLKVIDGTDEYFCIDDVFEVSSTVHSGLYNNGDVLEVTVVSQEGRFDLTAVTNRSTDPMDLSLVNIQTYYNLSIVPLNSNLPADSEYSGQIVLNGDEIEFELVSQDGQIKATVNIGGTVFSNQLGVLIGSDYVIKMRVPSTFVDIDITVTLLDL